MAMNRVQFPPGLSVPEFMALYGTDDLTEAQYRFSRGFKLRSILPRLLRAACVAEPHNRNLIRAAEVGAQWGPLKAAGHFSEVPRCRTRLPWRVRHEIRRSCWESSRWSATNAFNSVGSMLTPNNSHW
jgi:hypothetical protein